MELMHVHRREDSHHRLGDRLHDRHRRRAGRRRARRADPAARPLDRQRRRRRSTTRSPSPSTTPRRSARCAPRSSTPTIIIGRPPARPRQAGRLTMHDRWPCTSTAAQPVVGRGHRRLRRGARRRRAAHRPRLLVRTIDRRVVADPRHAQGGGGQHRRHRADPAGRRTAWTPCSPKASSTTCSSAGCSGRCGHDHAGRAVRSSTSCC